MLTIIIVIIILHTLNVSINIYFHFIYGAISNDGWLIQL